MVDNNDDRSSDVGSLEKSVASLVAQLPYLATAQQFSSLETKIETWKGEMNDNAHKIASAKVNEAFSRQTKAMQDRHERCALEFEKALRNGMDAHVKELHRRNSVTSDNSKKYAAIADAFALFVKRILPWVIAATGLGVGGYNMANSTQQQPATKVVPADTEG